jgi:hypothetical protein
VSALRTIAERAAEKKLQFLVSGGIAVVFHGYHRTTFDLDLVVNREQRKQWVNLLANGGYTIFREGETFLQFNPPASDGTPIDLMLTNNATFEKLLAEGITMLEEGVPVTTVSLANLIALKCHAIKHGHAGRVEKDVDDVIYLVLAKRLNMEDNHWRELILKYGTPELYKKLKKVSEG